MPSSYPAGKRNLGKRDPNTRDSYRRILRNYGFQGGQPIDQGKNPSTFRGSWKDSQAIAKFSRGRQSIYEIKVMNEFDHPNINKAEEVIEVEDQPLRIIIQKILTPLPQWRRSRQFGSSDSFLRVSQELISALAYLHRKGLIHCDVKSDNLLIGSRGRLILNDFDSTTICGHDGVPRTGCGRPRSTETHMAWELLRGDPWDWRIDTWAAACTIFEIIYDQLLFPVQKSSANNKERSPKDYQNALSCWELYRSDGDFGRLIYYPIPYQAPQIPPGMKNSSQILSKLLMRMLETFPRNRPLIIDLEVELGSPCAP